MGALMAGSVSLWHTSITVGLFEHFFFPPLAWQDTPSLSCMFLVPIPESMVCIPFYWEDIRNQDLRTRHACCYQDVIISRPCHMTEQRNTCVYLTCICTTCLKYFCIYPSVSVLIHLRVSTDVSIPVFWKRKLLKIEKISSLSNSPMKPSFLGAFLGGRLQIIDLNWKDMDIQASFLSIKTVYSLNFSH